MSFREDIILAFFVEEDFSHFLYTSSIVFTPILSCSSPFAISTHRQPLRASQSIGISPRRRLAKEDFVRKGLARINAQIHVFLLLFFNCIRHVTSLGIRRASTITMGISDLWNLSTAAHDKTLGLQYIVQMHHHRGILD
jgi:hypothetical protein